jgi:hypothetical protein
MNKKRIKAFKLSEIELKKIMEYCSKNDIRFSDFVRETITNRLKKVKKDKEE